MDSRRKARAGSESCKEDPVPLICRAGEKNVVEFREGRQIGTDWILFHQHWGDTEQKLKVIGAMLSDYSGLVVHDEYKANLEDHRQVMKKYVVQARDDFGLKLMLVGGIRDEWNLQN